VSATHTLKINCPSCQHAVHKGDESCRGCGAPLPRSVAIPTTTAAKGWGSDALGSFKCKSCGAEVVVDKTHLKVNCAYCGSEAVIAQPGGASGHDDDVRPDFLVPFHVKRARSQELFYGWIDKLWFAPRDLHGMATPERMRGVYLPFWGYDTDTHSHYTCEVGFDYTETETYTDSDGRTQTRTVTKTRWQSSSGWIRSSYRDVLVVASRGVDRELTVSLEPFHVSRKVDFSPEQLTGWEAERYALDHEKAWHRFGRGYVLELETAACESDAYRQSGADHVRFVSVEPHFLHLASKHLLLPLYVSAYEYGGKTYRFLINGDTGIVHGQRPFSVAKIAFAFILGLAIAALVGWAIVAFGTSSALDSSGLALAFGIPAVIAELIVLFFVLHTTSEKGSGRRARQV
jgi:DNA-directed RNA polymerase subunit RPC12/RpoP